MMVKWLLVLCILFISSLVALASIKQYNKLINATIRTFQMQQHETAVPFQESLPTFVPRIANGHPAAANQFPYQVSIMSPIGSGVMVSQCGGSIIHARWVLTAAHCTVDRPQLNLRFGSVDRAAGGIAQTSFRAIAHHLYNRNHSLNYDISLVAIPTPLTLGASILAIRLPPASQENVDLTNHEAIVSGWGNTGLGTTVERRLRWVTMRIITNTDCQAVYGNQMVVDHVVCAKGSVSSSNQGVCGGDSGGPLVGRDAAQQASQVGVVSFAASTGCDRGFPSGFIRTAKFAKWISGHTGISI